MSLDRLWAGWRSEYIDEVTSPASDVRTSVFRRILESGLPDDETHIVWRGAHTFAILNRFPYITGHVLVMPYREVGDDDVAHNTVGVNVRGGDRPERGVGIDEFLRRLSDEIAAAAPVGFGA